MALTHPSWTVDTTFSGKNIASAASVYTFTAAASAKIKITVRLTNAAGNGDYIVYLTHQWLGTGTASVVLPKTTCPAASGETSIEFLSMELDVKATDVVDVMIDGLAGDTSVSGAIRISADNPSVFDATSDVPAVNVTLWKSSPAPDLPSDPADQSAVEAAITTAAGALATFAQVAGLNNLSSAQAQAAAAAALAAYGAATGAVPTVSDIVDGVLDEALSGHTIAGSVGAGISAAGAAGDPWTSLLPGAYTGSQAGKILGDLAGAEDDIDAIRLVTDAIDVSSVTLNPTNDAGHLTITAALTFGTQITGLAVPSDWETALWTLKADASKADTAALVQLRVTNPAALTDGLQRLNGAAVASPLTAASGSLTVTQASGRIDIYLTDEATALLGAATGLGWDVKFIDAAGDSTGQRGTAEIALTETKTV